MFRFFFLDQCIPIFQYRQHLIHQYFDLHITDPIQIPPTSGSRYNPYSNVYRPLLCKNLSDNPVLPKGDTILRIFLISYYFLSVHTPYSAAVSIFFLVCFHYLLHPFKNFFTLLLFSHYSKPLPVKPHKSSQLRIPQTRIDNYSL